MVYVRRNSAGEIVAVSRESADGFGERVAPDDGALRDFASELRPSAGAPMDELQLSDQSFIRVLEDVVQLLDEKGLISLDELPRDARNKILGRQQWRRQLRGSNA